MDQINENLSESVALSESAITRVRALIAKEKRPATSGLRVGVANGGCSGMSYTLGFDDAARDDDRVFEYDGVHVFVDPESLTYLKGMVVDFADGLHGAGFRFTNPNAERTCGCGSSFAPTN
ncbi:MAG: iron-sulfur cluster assembly accessory protein [Deltaproteobacteria bacterium]